VRDGTHILLYYIRTKLIASVYYNWSESDSKEYVCIGAARSPGRECPGQARDFALSLIYNSSIERILQMNRQRLGHIAEAFYNEK
jgi:hypothetical protein